MPEGMQMLKYTKANNKTPFTNKQEIASKLPNFM